ncbi:MAG: leucyl aminopeptidase family protein [Oligoflexia bacterium]|nr:leucyl aminopeptidase family protein [Oligoflexia bacterium]MBF0366652.1 leucyl aminopeptidase family protein [Oligoflexia bacterium]
MRKKSALTFKRPANGIIWIAACKKSKNEADLSHWPKDYQSAFKDNSSSALFTGDAGKVFPFTLTDGKQVVWAIGLGDREKISEEKIRQALAQAYKQFPDSKGLTLWAQVESFNVLENISKTISLLYETATLTYYRFDKYLSEKKNSNGDKTIKLFIENKGAISESEVSDAIETANIIAGGVNFARDLINEVPNVQNSEVLAKTILSDAKKTLKSKTGKITLKLLGRKEITREKMGLFLAVNQGSDYEPQLVHLQYRPKKITQGSKHIALVGKGLTFDSGGYSLKPSNSITEMKTDMAGAATVYAAFRNAVLQESPHTISCFLGMTDNLISPAANLPDAVIKGRAGKSVEILSTDAEGRLVLADLLDYACDFKPDIIIDVATLTGACVRALGHVVGVMGNSRPLIEELLKASEEEAEPMWQLPIIDEYRDDIKATIADLRNSTGGTSAGAQKAAAFLEHFIRDTGGKNKIKWAHLDIAGINSATHLHYSPKGSATGTMVRTLTHFLLCPLHLK